MFMKVGLLLPRSSYYTSIAFDILDGLRQRISLDGNKDVVNIFSENIGFGAEKQAVYRAAEQLIIQHDVDVVFGYIGHSMAQLLRPLFLSTNRLLIVLDAGASMPQEWPRCENIIYHSLNNSLGAFYLGELVRRDGIREAAFSTCYYDGGYLHTLALAKGLERAEVAIRYNIATGYIREGFSMSGLKPYMESGGRKAVAAIFSGDFLQWFFQEMNSHFKGGEEAIYLPPFALEEKMLEQAPFPNGRVKGVASWSVDLQNRENDVFVRKMHEEGKTANLFSLLGWEAGQLIDILKNSGHLIKAGNKAVEHLMESSFETPRGTVAFAPEVNTSYGPLYEADIVENGRNGCKLDISSAISAKAVFSEMIQIELNNAVSGWQNSYVCN